MKKIAICIPSYNEKDNISNTVIKIDKELSKFKKEYEVIIVNVDNNSPDKTSEVFIKTKTICPKLSIINKEMGKGINLLKFFEYCKKENIDYAVTIDADVKSLKSNWISKFLKPLIEDNYDYVTPIYKRSRYEGSTTNHFAFPLVYAISGIPIRQPIAGDFAFNKNFINLIEKYEVNEYIKKYGIDIYMTLIAACNKLKIKQIELEKKIHNPSYNKMEKMFHEILKTYIFIYKILKKENKVNNNIINIDKNINSIISSRTFNHKEQAIKMYNYYSNKVIIKESIEKDWLVKLKRLIINIDDIDSTEFEEIYNLFILRSTSFWLKSCNMSSKRCEEIIINQALELIKSINGGEYEYYNN